MMTSRAEYRLILRQDNADLRLTEYGRRVGLVSDARYERFQKKKAEIEKAEKFLRETRINPSLEINEKLEGLGIKPIHVVTTLYDLLRRPEADYELIQPVFGLPEISKEARQQVDISITYDGYIKKQQEQVNHMERLENKLLPEDIDYRSITSLRDEAREKLSDIRPRSVGQASRISGVSPADISVLLIYLEQQHRLQEENK